MIIKHEEIPNNLHNYISIPKRNKINTVSRRSKVKIIYRAQEFIKFNNIYRAQSSSY